MIDVDETAWASTIQDLDKVHRQICELHETPSKNFTPAQVELLKQLRAECVLIHYRRIAIVQQSRVRTC